MMNIKKTLFVLGALLVSVTGNAGPGLSVFRCTFNRNDKSHALTGFAESCDGEAFRSAIIFLETAGKVENRFWRADRWIRPELDLRIRAFSKRRFQVVIAGNYPYEQIFIEINPQDGIGTFKEYHKEGYGENFSVSMKCDVPKGILDLVN